MYLNSAVNTTHNVQCDVIERVNKLPVETADRFPYITTSMNTQTMHLDAED